MGGVFALKLATQLGNQVAGSIIIDTTMPNDPTASEVAFIHSLATDTGTTTLRSALIDSMFNPEFDDREMMMNTFETMIATWQQSPANFTTQLNEALQLDKRPLIQDHHQPLLYISCAPPRGDIDAIRSLKLDTQFQHINAGHFAMLNQPTQLTQYILSFIK